VRVGRAKKMFHQYLFFDNLKMKYTKNEMKM
jgi:hypothetical protein